MIELDEYLEDLAAARQDGRDEAAADVERLADVVAELASTVAMLAPQQQPPAPAKPQASSIADAFNVSPDELVRLGGVSKALAHVRKEKL